MAPPSPQSSHLRPNAHCLVFGGERCDGKQIDAAVNHLGLAAPRLFDAEEWFHQTPGLVTDRVTPVIVLDGAEGIGEEDRFYARLVRFLDLPNPVVLVANLDLIGYEQEQFNLVQDEFHDVLAATNLTPIFFGPLPLDQPGLIPWWRVRGIYGSHSDPLGKLDPPTLRMRVSSSTSEEGVWTVAGTVMSGSVAAGDQVLCSPSNRQAAVQTISDIGDGTVKMAFEEPLFVEPGEIISHENTPPVETDVFRVKALWSGEIRAAGNTVNVETAYGKSSGTIQSFEEVLSPSDFMISSDSNLAAGRLVEAIVRVERVIALDHIASLPGLAGIALTDAHDSSRLLATGHISMEGYADQRQLLTSKAINTTPIEFAVGDDARAARNGHDGGVLWFTGLSGSGKSTLAVALEARLFEKGYQVFVLDGDNVRQGLTSNLGFSPGDRSENIRRVGEVAALFRQAGVIVISSFISPYRSDRDRARHAAYSSFHEIYIKADIKTCIDRDPKGLYERAIRGDIPDFTGISAPYEAPGNPELIIDTGVLDVDACIEQLVNYVDRNFRV